MERFNFVSSPNDTDKNAGFGVVLLQFDQSSDYVIVFDFNGEKGFQESSNDVRLSGTSEAGELKSIYWDGKNGKGVNIQNGDQIVCNLSVISKSSGNKYIDLNYSISYLWNADVDQDSVINSKDLDGDNDGLTAIDEYAGENPYNDIDKDNIPNYLDADFVSSNGVAFEDENLDGINDLFDADKDGVVNDLDVDVNNDGVYDIYFTGLVDNDDNGRYDEFHDMNDDGLTDDWNELEITLKDFDQDSILDFLDVDCDNDGLLNTLECQNVGVVALAEGFDADGDGMYDAFDRSQGNWSLNKIYGGTPNFEKIYKVKNDGILYTDNRCDVPTKVKAIEESGTCNKVSDNKKCIELSIDNVVNPDEKEIILEWEMGDGLTERGRKIRHCYAEQGNYLVRLHILDAADETLLQDEEVNVSIATLSGYSIAIEMQDESNTTNEVPFKFSAVVLPGYIVESVMWDFGDGDYTCESFPNHRFPVEGTYEVKLYVTLKSGSEFINFCDTKSITVKN